MSKIKVMHVIGGGEFGGAEEHIITLLKAINGESLEVRLCCLFPDPLVQIAQAEGIAVDYLKMGSKFDVKAIYRLADLLKQYNIDIVHTHGVRANLIGRLAAKIAGIPIVITTVHSILKHDYTGFLLRNVNNALEKMTKSLTTHFIAVSKAIKDSLIEQGVNKDNISVIHNGIDLSKYKPGKSEYLQKKIPLANGGKVIGIIARFHPVKGHKYFLEAARILSEKGYDLNFVLIGDGPLRMEIESLINQFGINERVFLLGFQKNISEILQSLDILVIPSISEGFGLTAVEAMATKVPVVATEVGGLPDIISDAETGILVPPENAEAIAQGILQIINNNEYGEKLAEKGYSYVNENFSSQIMASTTESLYFRLSKCNLQANI